ncbi:MAG TPA: MFS transporter [Syntrophales bacterium]|nr:MFS transporter [Syntrophales bacterium]
MDNEKKIVLFTFTAHFLFHFYELTFPALAIPLVFSLNMNLENVLKLGFPMYLCFGLFSLPWGIFADRFGNRIALIMCFFGTGIGSIMTVLAKSPLQIMLSLGVIGAFAGICHPAGMGLISLGVKNRGIALGINAIAGSVGLTAAPFMAGLLNWIAGWKAAYLAAAVFALSCGIAMLFSRIDETPLVHEHEKRHTFKKGHGAYLPSIILFFSIVTLGGLAYRVNIVVLPTYLEWKASFLSDLFHFQAPAAITMAAGMLTSIIFVVGIVGQLFGGKMADRCELRRLYLIFNAISLPFVIMMAYGTEQFLFVAAAVYVFFALGIQPIENSLIAKFTPQEWRSTGYGFASVLIFGVGSLSIYLVGWVKDTWHLGFVYIFSAIMVIMIVAGIMLLMRMTKDVSFRNF